MIAPAMLSFLAAVSLDAAEAMNERSSPAIARYGSIVPVPGAAMRADPKLNYRVAFSVTKAERSTRTPGRMLVRSIFWPARACPQT